MFGKALIVYVPPAVILIVFVVWLVPLMVTPVDGLALHVNAVAPETPLTV